MPDTDFDKQFENSLLGEQLANVKRKPLRRFVSEEEKVAKKVSDKLITSKGAPPKNGKI